MEDEHETSALHARRKNRSPMGRLSCCFSGDHRRAGSLFDFSSSSFTIIPSPNRKSPSSWIRSKNFIPRMGKHRRHSSADFSYDPLSYSLNFEDNDDHSDLGYEPPKNFSSRLPTTPPRATIVASTPSPGKTLCVSKGISDQLPSSRAVAVAEVVKNLALSPSETRRNHDLHTARRPSSEVRRNNNAAEMPDLRKQSTLEVQTQSQRKVVPAAEDSRNTERSTPRAAAVAG